MLSIGVFSITHVDVAQNKNLDLFSVIFLGAVSALEGRTIRDMILEQDPVFWIKGLWFLWVVIITTLIAFLLSKPYKINNK